MNLSREHARRVLLGTVGPRPLPDDPDAVLGALRQIQVDPIDRIGTNPDLVAFARTEGLGRTAIYGAAGFEHYAKEWCLLPPEAFPHYREAAALTPTWRHTSRMLDLPDAVLDAVEADLAAKGPCTPAALDDHGRLPAVQGTAWKGSSRVGTLALKVLALRCRAVVVGRERGSRVYDLPGRALGDHATAEADGPFGRWALVERVRAAGMLSMGSGPWWSMLKATRTDGTLRDLLAEGRLVEVGVEGMRRRWLVEPASLDVEPHADDHLRILGPLDPVVWNRELVEHLFGFRYVWEIYKPADQREWGYYVVPLLHDGHLVGRLEAVAQDGRLRVDRVWREAEGFDDAALEAALDRLAPRLGVTR
ncbi:MAG: winged helix DNA-binding domain-containing protein [Alphaproteobacteria bacterium]|nr:winged helix DNA-binding domain-containing protein [Alphaproteobacteria bacterium]MCB9693840.1 winged helix DNA-binding domain-containing protein [Alphaproteobacteria bacterium]